MNTLLINKSQEEAIRKYKRDALQNAVSLVVFAEYESHRTIFNTDLPKESRIFIQYPVRINKLSWSKQVSKYLFAFEAVYCGV